MTGGRLHGHYAGQKAVPVFVCTNRACELHHKAKAPVQCHCGGIEFDRFDSTGEAQQWARYRMHEKRGLISNLRRQVDYPLYAPGPLKVADYRADFVFERDGKTVVGDWKPDGSEKASKQDPVFSLKRRWMLAQGVRITIVTSQGEMP